MNVRQFLSKIIMLLCTVTFMLCGTTYYVDSEYGQDTNPGTMNEPWKHCPGMSGWNGSAVLVPGDTIYLHNERTWQAASGNALLQITGGVVYDGRTWGSGSRALLRATGDLPRSVINIMEDHADEATVIAGFEVDANHYITSGITVNWPQATGNLVGALKHIEDCIVYGVYSQSSQGQYEYGILISSGWGGNRWVSNVEITDCIVYDISRGCINIYAANDDPGSGISNVLVRGCHVYVSGTDPNYAGSCLPLKNHVIDAVIEYNYIHDPVRGLGMGISTHPQPGFTGPENAVIRHNIISGSQHCGIFMQGAGDKHLDIYGNIIVNSAYEGIRLASSLEDTLAVRIFNNTFFRNYQQQWSQELRIESNNAIIPVLDVRNNVFCADLMTRCLVDDDGDITDHSNNIYFRPGNDVLVISNGTSYDAATVQTWESTAIVDDPQFKNEADLPAGFTGTYGVNLEPIPDGLNITGTSPAKDNGAQLGSTYCTSINSIVRPSGNGWDIGAYEFDVTGISEYSECATASCRDMIIMNKNRITFNLPIQVTSIVIYDILGRLIHDSGSITRTAYTWGVTRTTSGIYFYEMKGLTGTIHKTGKIILIK
jgi:hypothetical protein